MNISWMSRSLPTRPLIRYSLRPGAFGQLGIFQSDGDFGESQRRTLGGAIENAIGHALGTERFVTLFAENPGNGIHDVGFAAAVRPDDAGRAGPAECDNGSFTKRFKANDFNFSQLQQDVPFWSSTSPRLPA